MPKNFGKMSIHRGNKFTFTGMYIKINDDGKVKIVMNEYIQEYIYLFGEDISQ